MQQLCRQKRINLLFGSHLASTTTKTKYCLLKLTFYNSFLLTRGFGPKDIPRDYICHDTPKAFPHIFIILSSQTSKEEFLFIMVSLGTPMENGEGMKPPPLVELNPNMLGWDVERMGHYLEKPRG